MHSYIYVGRAAGCSLQLLSVKQGLRIVLPNQMMPLAVLCADGVSGCVLTLGKATSWAL